MGHTRDLQTGVLFKRGLGVSEQSELTPCIIILLLRHLDSAGIGVNLSSASQAGATQLCLPAGHHHASWLKTTFCHLPFCIGSRNETN